MKSRTGTASKEGPGQGGPVKSRTGPVKSRTGPVSSRTGPVKSRTGTASKVQDREGQ